MILIMPKMEFTVSVCMLKKPTPLPQAQYMHRDIQKVIHKLLSYCLWRNGDRLG